MLFALENVIKQRMQGAGYCLHIRHLHVASGAQIALTGPSGCGKSTALDILGMVLQPDSAARFTLETQEQHTDVAALWQSRRLDDMAALRRQYMGYVLQTGGLLPFLTVAENMALSARMQGQAPSRIKKNVDELAGRLGIAHLLHALPATLSVGERQRTAIGRALVPRPALVLADEPTAALDPVHAGMVMTLFREAAHSLKATLIMVSHDLELVRGAGLREVPMTVRMETDGKVRAIIDDQGTQNDTAEDGKESGHA